MKPIRTDLSLSNSPKAQTHPQVLQFSFNQIIERYREHLSIFTDASKSYHGVGSAVVLGSMSLQFKLPEPSTILTAELFGIKKAIDYAASQPAQEFLVCTDSLSSLKILQQLYQKNPLAQDIRENVHNLPGNGTNLIFIYTPSHVNIEGNEAADTFAKQAVTSSELTSIEVYIDRDLKSHVETLLKSSHNGNPCNDASYIHAVKPTYYTQLPLPSNRKEQVVLSRLRIGHTRLTHQHLFEGRNTAPPECIMCNLPMTVNHILFECAAYNVKRRQFNVPDNPKAALGENISAVNRVLDFLRDIDVSNL